MNRHFKLIEEFDSYTISCKGMIFSKKRNKVIKHNNSYVSLYKEGKKYIRSVDKLIKTTFIDNFVIEDDSTEFKPVLNFENYLVDKFGNIYSKYKKKIRKDFINSSGYNSIILYKEGKAYNRLVHRLVYESWNGKVDDNIKIFHIDNNKRNNKLLNLYI
jgi:hypothetical protein